MRPGFPLSLLVLSACSSHVPKSDPTWVPGPATDLGSVVARVGEVPIYASQVLAEAKRSGKTIRQAFDAVLDLHLLAERARRSAVARADGTDRDLTDTLVQRILERDLEPKLREESMPDSTLRPIYDRAKESFVHPRLVEIAMLAVYTGARMKGDPLEERTRTAHDLYAYVQAHPPRSADAMAAIARDPAWSARHVVYDRFLQSPDRPLSPKVGHEIVKLRSDGDTTGLLSDDDGFYIARYVGERPPENITFEEIRPKLAAGYLERWQQQQFLDFTGSLMQAHKVEAFFDRLSVNEQGP